MMYSFLNYFFFTFHSFLILFNTLGWLFKKTRFLNLITLSITFFSWFILGIWYGWGYCFCTDWHWIVRRKMGFRDMSNSYNHFLIKKITGIDLSIDLVNTVTIIIFLLSLLFSVWFNIRDKRNKN